MRAGYSAGYPEVVAVSERVRLGPLVDLVRAGPACVLSGAGLSTESGIPDYRGLTGRARPATPMRFSEFVGNAAARRRYWARSHAGWSLIRDAKPNDGHRAVAALQRIGAVAGIITQNVDGLHQAGGADRVLELHGGLDRVVCLDCHAVSSRAELDARLTAANPDLAPRVALRADSVKPDGDTDLSPDAVTRFQMVDCLDCGHGLLKPDVVFFGEFLPPGRVQTGLALIDTARVLLVLGSSLTVASGYRFVRQAEARGIPVAIINQGHTRGDKHATLKVDAPLGAVLAELNALIE